MVMPSSRLKKPPSGARVHFAVTHEPGENEVPTSAAPTPKKRTATRVLQRVFWTADEEPFGGGGGGGGGLMVSRYPPWTTNSKKRTSFFRDCAPEITKLCLATALQEMTAGLRQELQSKGLKQ
jgi:hypothetical protein